MQAEQIVRVGVFDNRPIVFQNETGLIISLGGWVIQQALADLRHWRAQGLQVERLAINLSARQLFHVQTHDILQQSLEGDPGSARVLELEITESGIMQYPEQAVQTLNAFKELGGLRGD